MLGTGQQGKGSYTSAAHPPLKEAGQASRKATFIPPELCGIGCAVAKVEAGDKSHLTYQVSREPRARELASGLRMLPT